MALYDKASLVLIPSGTKEGKVFSQKPTNGDGDFQITRASSATRVNSDGLIEKETQNLILQSNTFDTTWIASGVSLTSGQSGYDGNDAWLLDIISGTDNQNIRQVISQSGVQTFSIYLKSGTLDWALLLMTGSVSSFAYCNISNGTFGNTSNLIDYSSEDVGGGWYKFSITFTETTTAARIYLATSNNNVTQSSGSIYIQDAQLNQGLVADPYLKTTTEAVYGGITDNIPRLDYTDASCPSLLLEPQRSNKIPYSEYFEDASFSYSSITLEGGYLAPDGTNSAYKITATNSSLAYLAYASIALADDARSIYARSVSGTGTAQLLSHNSNTNNLFTLNEEWQRFELNSTPLIEANFYPVDFRGGGTLTELIIWGAQLEESSYATSYIPTYGASVTALKDVCNSAGNASTFNSEEGVLYVEIAALVDDQSYRYITLSDGTNSNYVIIRYYNIANKISAFIENTSGIQGSTSYSFSPLETITDFHKVAFKWKANDFALWIDGTEVSTQSSGTTFSANVLNKLQFNEGDGSGNNFYGKTKMVAVFPYLTDEELEALTTI